jgi:hypothetical protein
MKFQISLGSMMILQPCTTTWKIGRLREVVSARRVKNGKGDGFLEGGYVGRSEDRERLPREVIAVSARGVKNGKGDSCLGGYV